MCVWLDIGTRLLVSLSLDWSWLQSCGTIWRELGERAVLGQEEVLDDRFI